MAPIAAMLLFVLLGVVAAAQRRRRIAAAAVRRGIAQCWAPPPAAAPADAADAAFEQQYPGYGYEGGMEAIAADFAHLPRDEVYLDHAGSTLCAASQVRRHAYAVLSGTLGNPHSRNPAGQRTAQVVRRARELVLRHFEASERDYAVVFTSGCTGAVQMLAQHFRWTPGKSVLGYALCNHNSVLGMREAAKQHGCPFVCVPPSVVSGLLRPGAADREMADEQQRVDGSAPGEDSGDEGDDGLVTPRTEGWESNASDVEDHAPAHLFVFSPECNFSGTKTDLALASLVQQGHLDKHINTLSGPAAGCAVHRLEAGGGQWYVLVDAAKAAATSKLSLGGEHRPDFVAISFYKMMGMPTGLGALLIRRDSAWQLDKRSFAGGSVLAVQPDRDFFKLRESLSERFEDGSPAFLAILAAAQGLDMLQSLDVRRIAAHTWSLRDYLAHSLTQLRHSNGVPLVTVYGAPPGSGSEVVGSICTFNLRRPDGQYVEYSQVEELAGLSGLSLRTGAFCNPGAAQHYLNLSREEVDRFLALGKVCGDDRCVLDGKPTGAIRASFGYMSTRRDADTLVCFVSKYFLDQAAPVPCPVLAGSCTSGAVPREMSTHERACLEVEAEVETEHSKAADSSSVCLPYPQLELQGLQGLQGVPDPLQFRTFVKGREGVGGVAGGLMLSDTVHHVRDMQPPPHQGIPVRLILSDIVNHVSLPHSSLASLTKIGAGRSEGDEPTNRVVEDVAKRQQLEGSGLGVVAEGEPKAQNVVAGDSPAQRRVGGEESDVEGGGGVGGTGERLAEGVVQEIYVYPIKSCAGYACLGDGGWPLTSTGLLYDRCVLFFFFFI
jgi:selenocysteine lyase/cysteine desulfurase